MTADTNTIKLHRVLRAPAARVYKAFLDPDAMVKWLPPHGFTAKMHSMDARVGGGSAARSRTSARAARTRSAGSMSS